jgi:hypothetical protein
MPDPKLCPFKMQNASLPRDQWACEGAACMLGYDDGERCELSALGQLEEVQSAIEELTGVVVTVSEAIKSQ